MRWLLFLSRLGFICGLLLLVSITFLIREWSGDQAVVSTVVIIGQVIGVVVLPVVNLGYLFMLFARRKITSIIPAWLVVANVLFLVILVLYFLYQNGQHNYQA
ncbi:hypothetical protein [Ferruginibacter sp.]